MQCDGMLLKQFNETPMAFVSSVELIDPDVLLFVITLKAKTEMHAQSQSLMTGQRGALASTSGFASNALADPAHNERKRSWLARLMKKKSDMGPSAQDPAGCKSSAGSRRKSKNRLSFRERVNSLPGNITNFVEILLYHRLC